jgi:hypothetical protein
MPFPHSLPFRFLPILSPFLGTRKRPCCNADSVAQQGRFFKTAFLNYRFLADKGLKFLSLDQLFGSHKKDERTSGGAQHVVNPIDPDVAVLSGFPDR